MLNKLRDEIHQNAVEHGWWDEGRSFGDIIALCHSELSEALEAFRSDYPGKYAKCNDCGAVIGVMGLSCCGKPMKPEGIVIELADTIIRILDFCGQKGIDIEEAIRIKHEYNKTRPYKHGGKKI
jgi:NTP pyrophosphatase (non-canonical NTP hydrolase)